MKSLVIAFVVLGLGHVLAPSLATADDRATAERYFRAGARAYAAQNFAAAAADFDEAYATLPLPEIAFSGAQAYRRLYRVDAKPEYVRRAVELYRIYLAKVKSGGRVGDAADSLGELERELDKLKAKGAAVEARNVERTRLGIDVSVAGQISAGTAVIEVGDAASSSIAGLHVTLDGKPVEPYALVEVEPGEHAIEVAADGYVPVARKQRAVAGASALVEVSLEAKPATLAITTESDARIAVDGRVAPSTRLELAAGTHVVVVTHAGRVPFEQELTVTRGQSVSLAAPLAKTGRRRAVPWLAGGAGVLAAAAIATATVALVHDSDASELRDAIAKGDRPAADADSYAHHVELRDDYKTAAIVLGSSAVIAGGIAAMLYWFDDRPAEGVHVLPTASPTSAGLAARGSF